MEEKEIYYIHLSFADKLCLVLQYELQQFLPEEYMFTFLLALFLVVDLYILKSINILTLIFGIFIIVLISALMIFKNVRKLEKKLKIELNHENNTLFIYNHPYPIDSLKILFLGSDASVYFSYTNTYVTQKASLMYFHYKFEKNIRNYYFNKKFYKQIYIVLKQLNLPILTYILDDDIYEDTLLDLTRIKKDKISTVIHYVEKLEINLIKRYQDGGVYLYKSKDVFVPYITRSVVIFLVMELFYRNSIFFLLMMFFGIIAYPSPYLFVDLMSYGENKYGLKSMFLNMKRFKDFLKNNGNDMIDVFDFVPLFDFNPSQVNIVGLEDHSKIQFSEIDDTSKELRKSTQITKIKTKGVRNYEGSEAFDNIDKNELNSLIKEKFDFRHSENQIIIKIQHPWGIQNPNYKAIFLGHVILFIILNMILVPFIFFLKSIYMFYIVVVIDILFFYFPINLYDTSKKFNFIPEEQEGLKIKLAEENNQIEKMMSLWMVNHNVKEEVEKLIPIGNLSHFDCIYEYRESYRSIISKVFGTYKPSASFYAIVLEGVTNSNARYSIFQGDISFRYILLIAEYLRSLGLDIPIHNFYFGWKDRYGMRARYQEMEQIDVNQIKLNYLDSDQNIDFSIGFIFNDKPPNFEEFKPL